MNYTANEKRYENMLYNYCGNSGLKIPKLSLGLWHNFSETDNYKNMVKMIKTAFDLGITHFDIANNYGMPYPGSAETNFGRILKKELKGYRNEMVISTKAGFYMWPGPYGDFGSRKYLISSLDDSLKRLNLDYVDIFYHHRMDKNTPLEETMGALSDIVRSGKALYVGLSNYDAKTLDEACKILKEQGITPIIHQVRASMFDRHIIEDGSLETTHKNQMGSIIYSPLEQGILSDKYLKGIPKDSRAAKPGAFLTPERITKELLDKVSKLNDMAKYRGQTLSQMAISYLLGAVGVTSVLIGASSSKQIEENAKAVFNTTFTQDEIAKIDEIITK